MIRLIIAGTLAAVAFDPASAAPSLGKCLLRVDGTTYINGPCNIDLMPDGSFSIGADGRSPFFAYVTVLEPGLAQGDWNETPASTHAHSRLGELQRKGACWANRRATVCAWK